MVRKALAIGVSACVLLSQAAEVVRPSSGWYWPFMDYPMYSGSHPAGATVYQNRFVVSPCDSLAPPRVIPSRTMGVKPFDFQHLLDLAAAIQERYPTSPESRDWAIAELSRLALIRVDGDNCGAGVEVRRHRIDPVAGYREPLWEPVRAWPLDRGGTDTPAPDSTTEAGRS